MLLSALWFQFLADSRGLCATLQPQNIMCCILSITHDVQTRRAALTHGCANDRTSRASCWSYLLSSCWKWLILLLLFQFLRYGVAATYVTQSTAIIYNDMYTRNLQYEEHNNESLCNKVPIPDIQIDPLQRLLWVLMRWRSFIPRYSARLIKTTIDTQFSSWVQGCEWCYDTQIGLYYAFWISHEMLMQQ